jgi:hypothetical protein
MDMKLLRAAASLAFAVSGTPSHFELTFGTVDGSFCVDTPCNPTALARAIFPVPAFSAACLRVLSANSSKAV